MNDGNGGANYTITYNGDNFAITPRGITITADAGRDGGDVAFPLMLMGIGIATLYWGEKG